MASCIPVRQDDALLECDLSGEAFESGLSSCFERNCPLHDEEFVPQFSNFRRARGSEANNRKKKVYEDF